MRTKALRQLRPLKIDLYILGEIVGPFMGGVVFFSFIFLMFQALRLADFFIVHDVPGIVLLKLIGLLTLSFLPTALPIAFLIGVLIGFGRLSADSELVALKANGISLQRMSVPVLILALPVVVVSLGLNLEWVPWGDRNFKKTLVKVSSTKSVSSIKEGTFTTGFFDLLIYADRLDPKTQRLHRVFIYDEREPKNPFTVVAQEGEILPVETGSELGAAAVLKLYRGNIHRNDAGTNTYQKIDFGEYRLYLRIDEGNEGHAIKPKMFAYKELRAFVKKNPHVLDMYGELWRRYSVALSPLVFVFLGIGYGSVRTRAVRANAFMVAFGAILLFWGIQAVATTMVHKGHIHPILGMQLPNLVLGALAFRGFRSAMW